MTNPGNIEKAEFSDFIGPLKLVRNEKPREVRHEAHRAIPLLPGQKLKIEIDGMEILKVEVPAGEEWEAGIDINIRVKDLA